jgi:hyaluronoglucosaminidase
LIAGVIEGFFGKSWDWSARLSCADFLAQNGYQFYIYAPKGDPYLRRRWREPLLDATLEQLHALSARCRQRGISFGVGLTPYEIYLNYDAAARSALRAKVEQINDVGADRLCILFDDMRGDIEGIASLQAQVIADVCGWSNAASFVVCPTYYSYDSRLTREFGPPPKTYLQDFGRLIDRQIDIFWTGEKVISESYSADHLSDVAADIRRKPFIWDNHSSNDSKIRTQFLYLDPSASTWSLPAESVSGIAFDPMNQAYLSRIALCGYQNQDGFEEICRQLCGPGIGQAIIEDAATFRNVGLSGLDADARAELLTRYEAVPTNCYAQDMAAWLRGDYTFDPQCLTT